MFKINYLYIVLLFALILGSTSCDEKKIRNSKKYEYDIKLHNMSGKNLDWCSIYIKPPQYNVFFESFGFMTNGIHGTKSSMYGIIPNKARLSYLFENEVDKIAEMRKTGRDEEEKDFFKKKEKFIEFDIDTSKIPDILKKEKVPFLILKIVSLDKIESEIVAR